MPEFHVMTSNQEKFTTGRPRDLLASMGWQEIVGEYQGARRAMIIADLERFDIRPEVRVVPGALAALQKRRGLKSQETIAVPVAETEVEIGPEWKGIRAPHALNLWLRQLEDETLGADYSVVELVADGQGGKIPGAVARSGQRVLEFRMPARGLAAVGS